MININLVNPRKRKARAAALLGIDLKAINVKALIMAVLGSYALHYASLFIMSGRENSYQKKIDKLNTALTDLNDSMAETEGVKGELDEFNKNFNELKQINKKVEEILSDNFNPFKLLEYIARNIPKDVWLTKLEITSEKDIALTGVAISYKSIGDFITRTNATTFFKGSFDLEKSTTFNQKSGSKLLRLEQFSIKGNISNADPFL